MKLLFTVGTFQYLFRYCEYVKFDIFKSVFLVRFEAKGPNVGMLPNVLVNDGIFGDVWHKHLYWPVLRTTFCGCNLAYNSFKKRLLTILFVPHVGSNTKSKI